MDSCKNSLSILSENYFSKAPAFNHQNGKVICGVNDNWQADSVRVLLSKIRIPYKKNK